jgi:protein CpxP
MKSNATLIALLLLVSCAYAQAQAPSANAPPPSKLSPPAMAKADANRDAKVEQHIKDLHAKLKITPAEEAQWYAVATTMRENATELDKVIDKREASIQTATAVDDLTAYGDIAQAHADAVKRLSSAFSPLYASMPDEQKRLADEVFAHRQHKSGKT